MSPFRPGHRLPSPSQLLRESHRGESAPILTPAGLEISSDNLIKELRFSWRKAKQLSREWNQSLRSVNDPYLSGEKILRSPHPACDMRLDKICLGGMTWPVARLSDHSNHTLSLYTGHCSFWVSMVCQLSFIQLARIIFIFLKWIFQNQSNGCGMLSESTAFPAALVKHGKICCCMSTWSGLFRYLKRC